MCPRQATILLLRPATRASRRNLPHSFHFLQSIGQQDGSTSRRSSLLSCRPDVTDRPTDGVLARRRTILVKFIIKRSNCASRIADGRRMDGGWNEEDKQTRTEHAAEQKASIVPFKDAGKADVERTGGRTDGRTRRTSGVLYEERKHPEAPLPPV